MGLISSRQNTGNDETESSTNHLYRFPTKNGNYFSNYFIMGGEKFDTPQPETYLFGDNMDLNFLGNRPVPFPYPAPQTADPTRPLKCLINIRKESLRFVRANASTSNEYNIEFIFDADVKCAITIHYFCTEEITSNGLIYHSKDDKLKSDMYHYKRGASQHFKQTDHIFTPDAFPEEDLHFSIEKEVIPVVIHCIALDGSEDYCRQSHATLAVIDHHEEVYSLKCLKQKLFADGLCYLLQEIYGIENKLSEETGEDQIDDGGLECVICMSDLRDTLILPCRHLCLCHACADAFRYQANNCPICRSPFRALLQIKALQKFVGGRIVPSEDGDEIPIGFKHISLVESLNGPTVMSRRCSERISKTLMLKAALKGQKNSSDGDCESRDDILSFPRGKLACLDTEDEDKSSSITDHLLHNKSLPCSPDTVHHVTEILNTEDELPDEDSEAEKLSPLLEVGITYEANGTSKIEISVTDVPRSEMNKSVGDCKTKSVKSTDKADHLSDIPAEVKIDIPETCIPDVKAIIKEKSENNIEHSLAKPEILNINKEITSQHSTPASVASFRSCDDTSYSSSSSSKQLLYQEKSSSQHV